MPNAYRAVTAPLWNRLPASVDARVRGAAWASLAVQIGIVFTGGLVRLTGSGLGCPTWPRCTDESFVAVPEMGIHGAIEFGNRLLTFVLVAVAVVMFLFVWRYRRQRRDLFWLSLLVALYVPVQAILGGITVLTNLNPYVVGLHFFASVPLVGIAAALVVRVSRAPGPAVLVVPRGHRAGLMALAVVLVVTIIVGVLTTGAGPHAGDAGAARNGLNVEALYHLHSWPAYILGAMTVVLIASGWRLPTRPWLFALLGVELAQMTIGIAQARTHVENIWLVAIHMVLAMVLVALTVAAVMATKQAVHRPSGQRTAWIDVVSDRTKPMSTSPNRRG